MITAIVQIMTSISIIILLVLIPSENQVTAAFTNATVWGFYVSKSGGLYLQSTSNSPALNGLVNASNSFPIG